ncbi:UDP-N-acetylglucosamine 2-epimerase [Thermodesulfobium narugense DSM 14796]|uniref:UDP-N-acetylglucosamine 2-epimerase (non-hydrolyzing) n=1 Tax=Thermodesulfobium narugense DSM 14796 TaxID=747365 RepID=M1E5E9_9BACT|nr:UDP-N-acetylglucosamine 2-epimerase (non-hydrolyzing) [Thermodesulfobium narugense]AEE14226.1 UDP-N-acetylglucosamine 2-epimerase [Thermodesulfobium narugense DSM 14796]
MHKALLIFGTRPEAIKMAPLFLELKKSKHFEPIVVVTAQHREMLDQVLKIFNIEPDFDLDIMKPGQSLEGITIRALEGLCNIIKRVNPSIVLVQGDTTTTYVGALAAFYHKIAVGHVEAGLRTYDKFNPYPEEINRKMTTCLADLHFAPTITSFNNLIKENVKKEDIYITGNTVIDSLLHISKRDYDFPPILNSIINSPLRKILVTAHRRENWDEMKNIFQAIKKLVENFDDIHIIFPVHMNPKIRFDAQNILGNNSRVSLLEPLDYEAFIHVMKNCYLILTDSGGVQEEAPSLGIPVVVMRKTTERPEALKANAVVLSGTDGEKIYDTAARLLSDKTFYLSMKKKLNPYGDGRASFRILRSLEYFFKLSSERPEDFRYDYDDNLISET